VGARVVPPGRGAVGAKRAALHGFLVNLFPSYHVATPGGRDESCGAIYYELSSCNRVRFTKAGGGSVRRQAAVDLPAVLLQPAHAWHEPGRQWCLRRMKQPIALGRAGTTPILG
jgi:hypothetical protein